MSDDDPAARVACAACVDVSADGFERRWIEEDGALAITFAAHMRFARLRTLQDLGGVKCDHVFGDAGRSRTW